MKHLSTILALAILLTVGVACGDSGEKTISENKSAVNSAEPQKNPSSAATVESVALKNDDGETVTSFKPTDKKHKIEVKFSETAPGKVKGVFTAIDAGGEKNFKILENEVELGTLMNTATFTATIDKGFPAGDYKFDVYLGGKLIKTQNYKVQ